MKKTSSWILAFGLIIILGSCTPLKYTYRVFVYQESDLNDYKKFPSREIEKSEIPFQFIQGTNLQEKKIRSGFEQLELVNDLDKFLEKHNTHAFLVIRNDTLLYEKYFHGHHRESILTSFSAAKSFLSMLVGVAISQNKIQSIHDPITKYIPELLEKDSRFKKITIAHLMNMRSGLAYNPDTKFPFLNKDDPRTYYYPDLKKVVLKHAEIETEPDKEFLYNNYNPIILGWILERTTGVSVSEYLETNIWQAIGAEYNASWSLDEKGFEKMESGINAKAIDYAKVGRLILNEGKWDGKTVLEKGYTKESTQPINPNYKELDKWGYAYFWWSLLDESGASDIAAMGNYGQFIYVSPQTNTIIIRNGNDSKDFNYNKWPPLFYDYLRQGG